MSIDDSNSRRFVDLYSVALFVSVSLTVRALCTTLRLHFLFLSIKHVSSFSTYAELPFQRASCAEIGDVSISMSTKSKIAMVDYLQIVC